MKTIYVTDHEPDDFDTALSILANAFPEDIPIEVREVQSEPHRVFSLTYDETTFDEGELYTNLAIGLYAVSSVPPEVGELVASE